MHSKYIPMSASPYSHVNISLFPCQHLPIPMSTSPYSHVSISLFPCQHLPIPMSTSPYSHVSISLFPCQHLPIPMSTSPYSHVNISKFQFPQLPVPISTSHWGRNSSVGSAWARCHSVAGSILLWGHFPVEGIFPLELTWVQTPFPQNSFGWEYKPRSSLCTHAFHSTDSKDPDVHVLDGWTPATKNTPSTHHPRRRNVTTLLVGLKNGHISKNLTQKWWTPEI